MEILTVLDYCDSSINIYNISSDDNRDIEIILKELGHNIDECDWMFSENISINDNRK